MSDKSRKIEYLPPVEQDQAPPAQPKRPPHVWFFTWWFLLFAAFQPMAIGLAQIFTGNVTPFTVFRPIMALLVMVATYNAWRGKDWGRIMMLWTVTIHYAILIFLNAQLVGGVDPAEVEAVLSQRQAIGNIIQYSLLTLVNIVFCLHPSTVAFYRYEVPQDDSA